MRRIKEIEGSRLPRKILIARVDRIGDLILTLPMESSLRTLDYTAQISWLVEENLRFVMEARAHKSPVYYVEKAQGFSKLISWLKKEKFDEVYSVHVPWWIAFSFWWARIPVRVGVASQWFSWIFYNKAVRQRRSLALKSEAQYNLELIRSDLKLLPAKLTPNQQITEQWRARIGSDFVVIHPGMAGSARNWPLIKYKELAEKLIKRGNRVIVTGSALDRPMIEASEILKVNGVENYLEKTPGADLISVLSLAKAIVVPSTGVAHLGASLGKKVVGIYSPVKVQSPKRWGPMGDRVKVFSPEVECPGIMECLGDRCKYYDCMDKIEVDSIVNSVMEPT